MKIQYATSTSGPWTDFHDYDGDGNGEYIIKYYDQIITKKSELNGGTKNNPWFASGKLVLVSAIP